MADASLADIVRIAQTVGFDNLPVHANMSRASMARQHKAHPVRCRELAIITVAKKYSRSCEQIH